MKSVISSFFSLRSPSITPAGVFRHLKVALISDEFTRSCLSAECQVFNITPLNYKLVLKLWKPDLLFVESAWQGLGNAWEFKVASYPDYPRRNNRALRKVVEYARDLGIASVFWNKEDGVHFERFVDSAALFDTIFTVDENCVSRYQAELGPVVRVCPLMFAIQPAIHYPGELPTKLARACFVGSYNHHIHDRRRHWQDMMLQSAAPLGVTVFDRNSARRSANYRYPAMPWLEVRRSVPHEQTAQIYRDYMVSFNVNTIEDSGTMFSRRLIEIIACGGLAVTNPAPSVDRYFREFCEVVHDEDECRALLDRLQRHGLTPVDKERAHAGAAYVRREHTWAHRLEEIAEAVRF